MLINYKKICNEILKNIPQKRTRDIISRRFALSDEFQRDKECLAKKETLDSIGRSYGITRERVRQIEAKAVRKLQHPMRSRKLEGFVETLPKTT